MVGRKNAKGRSHRPLVRSKSVNCISSDPIQELQVIEPPSAERDAYAAARLSFQNAQSHIQLDASCTVVNGKGTHRRNSVASQRDNVYLGRPMSHSESCIGVRGSQPQQSVRFTGPDARPKKPLAVRANDGKLTASSSNATLEASRYQGTWWPGLDSTIDQFESPSDDKYYQYSRASRGGSYMLDDGGDTVIRHGRLRKSRSMFTSSLSSHTESRTSDRLKYWLSTTATGSGGFRKGTERMVAVPQGPILRRLKSISGLQHRADHNSRASRRPDNGNFSSSDIAKRTEQTGSHLGGLKSRRSMFFSARHRRSESFMGFSRTLRISSDNGAVISSAFSGDDASPLKHSTLRAAARKASFSFKLRLKSIFGRPKSVGSSDEYIQSLSYLTPGARIPRASSGIVQESKASICRVPSHTPSLKNVPSNQRMRSRQGSMESVKSDDANTLDDKSRVTSWTDSTADTIAYHDPLVDWERRRLSVIKENGMHVTSSSTDKPTAEQGTVSSVYSPESYPFDSQRVYSALIKRFQNTQQHEEHIGAETTDIDQGDGSKSPEKSLSDRNSSPQSPHTARRAKSNDDIFQDHYEIQLHTMAAAFPPEEKKSNKESGSTAPFKAKASYKAYPSPAAGDGVGLSPDRRRNTQTEVKSMKLFSPRGSISFASPNAHLFRTTSPYRRALQGAMSNVIDSEQICSPDARYLSSLSALSLPTRCPSTAGSERDSRMTYAKSIYSCVTDDVKACSFSKDTEDDGWAEPHTTPKPCAYNNQEDEIGSQGFAERSTTPTVSRDVSAASSVEWKRWLSADVSTLESSTDVKAEAQADTSFAISAFGHIREETVIDSPSDSNQHGAPKQFSEPRHREPLKPASASPRQVSCPKTSRKLTAAGQPSLASNDENFPPVLTQQSQDIKLTLSPIPIHSGLRPAPLTTCNKRQPVGEGKIHQRKNIPRIRSLNSISQTSPCVRDGTHFQRLPRTKLGRENMPSPAKSSPGLSAAVKKQFGASSMGSMGRGWQTRPGDFLYNSSVDDNNPSKYEDGCLVHWNAQTMGSKRMVDLFLSSRRKQMGSSSGSTTASDAVSSAFL